MSRAVNVVLYQGMFIYGRAFKVDYSVAKKKTKTKTVLNRTVSHSLVVLRLQEVFYI